MIASKRNASSLTSKYSVAAQIKCTTEIFYTRKNVDLGSFLW